MPIQYSQGGTCNIELAATFAPKPMRLIGDDGDWTHTYPTIEEGKTYDVEGMVSYYNNAVQIMPIAVTEVQATNVMRGDVNQDQAVDITDVTVLIDYLLSGVWPAAE